MKFCSTLKITFWAKLGITYLPVVYQTYPNSDSLPSLVNTKYMTQKANLEDEVSTDVKTRVYPGGIYTPIL